MCWCDSGGTIILLRLGWGCRQIASAASQGPTSAGGRWGPGWVPITDCPGRFLFPGAAWRCPKGSETFFLRGLTGCTEKSGGVRPIAVGCTLRRLVAKIAGRNYVLNYFSPVAIETMGAVGPKSMALLQDVGRHIAEETGELRTRDFLFQRLSVVVQRGNCVSVLGTITTWHFFIFLIFVFLFIFLYLCFFFFTS